MDQALGDPENRSQPTGRIEVGKIAVARDVKGSGLKIPSQLRKGYTNLDQRNRGKKEVWLRGDIAPCEQTFLPRRKTRPERLDNFCQANAGELRPL